MLVSQGPRDNGVGALGQEIRREADRRALIALGDQAGFKRAEGHILRSRDPRRSVNLGWIQLEEHLTRLHPVTFTDHNLAEHPTFKMLNRLPVAGGVDDTIGDHGAVQRREGGPAQDPHKRESDDGVANTGDAFVVVGRTLDRSGLHVSLSL